MRKAVLLFVLLSAVLMNGCVGVMVTSDWREMGVDKYSFDQNKKLKNDTFQITLRKVYCGQAKQNYYVYIKLKNISDKKTVFDAKSMELMDSESGLSYNPLSKEAGSVERSDLYADMITSASLKPGQVIEGFIMFMTPKGKATAQKLTLYFDDNYIELENIGLMPYEEWKGIFAGE